MVYRALITPRWHFLRFSLCRKRFDPHYVAKAFNLGGYTLRSRDFVYRTVEQFLFALVALGIFTSFIALVSCASGTVEQPGKLKYEFTLQGSVDGQTLDHGIQLGQLGTAHQITISSADSVNYFIAQTCHRFDKHQDVISQGWIPAQKTWTYNYTMAPSLEDTGDCPLRICQYSKTVGADPVMCGLIDFKNARYTLPFENICNGVDGQTSGKGICHTKVGLVERVRFKEAVFVADPLPTDPDQVDPKQKFLIKDQCDGEFIDQTRTVWQYTVPKDECYVIFDTVAKPHRRAKLLVAPYDLPIYTGGQ